MSLNVQILGVRQTLETFRELPRSIRSKHLVFGVSKGGGILKRAAQNFVRVDTGLLKKSLRVKTSTISSVNRGKDPWATIGPGRNLGRYMRRTAQGTWRGHSKANKTFLETVKLASGARPGEQRRAARAFTGNKFSDATFRNPSRYAHLVEKGTRRTRARPFLGMAVRIVGSAAQQAVIQKAQEGLKAEAAKRYAKSLTR